MKASIEQKLEHLLARHEELAALLGSPDVINNQTQFRDYAKEYAQLTPIIECYQAYKTVLSQLTDAEVLLTETDDPELIALARDELKAAQQQRDQLSLDLQKHLLPTDPDDDHNAFLEIRAGTGGDEAALFVGDLYRMYSRFAEQKGWQVELISANEGEHGGYKEIIVRITGQGVYAQLKFESGAHRVQRVPQTESQGRIHTSACTVAILPELTEVDAIEINPNDLRVDTFRASGAGGQHVNKTDSAIRLTHLPTGVVVECQDERSQHKNRARAMSLLQAKLLAQEKAKQQQARAQTRRDLVGSGDRSERIRTYNFPQGRMTDHRINLTLYKLDEIIGGDLAQVIEPLFHEYQADQLAALADESG